jgi:alcohol dehydrogenase
MKALVYHGPGKRAWEEVPDAVVQETTDAVVRVDAVTICGTDLHILGGDVPEVTEGRILGHEAVGTVTAVGSRVQKLAVGDRVLVWCISSCGSCRYCREGSYGQCLNGVGWALGHLIDGTHALPDGVADEQMITLADILPTAYEVGVLNGTVRPPMLSPSLAQGRSGWRDHDARLPARVTSSRSTWLIPGWRRHASSAPTWSSTAATTTLCR